MKYNRSTFLPGSSKDTAPLRACQGGCRKMQSTSGGVDIGDKWFCAGCWKGRLNAQRRKPK